MKKLKALIVDDEPHAIEGMSRLLELYCPEVEIAGNACSIDLAVRMIASLNPDIVFLDVHIKGCNGFDIVDVIESGNASIVFVTGHVEYAAKAFRVNAVDYLVKPVSYKELRVAVARAAQRVKEKLNEDQQSDPRVRLSTGAGVRFVQTKDIVGIEADGRYSVVHFLSCEKQMISRNIGDFELELDSLGFFRVHKSWLINRIHVKELLNDGTVELTNGRKVILSRRKKSEFIRHMQH